MHGALLRYKVSQRLTAAFTLLILITMAIAGSGFWALSTTESKLDKIVQDTMLKIRLSNEMLDSNAQVVSAIQGLLLEADPAKRDGYLQRVTSNRKAYDTAREQLFAMSSSERGLAQRAEITRTRDIARPANQAVIDAAMAGDSATAITAFEMSEKLTAEWQDAIRENVNLQNANGVTAYTEATAQAANGRLLLSIGTVLALLASALLAYGITRSLTVPLGAATQAADRIASGDVDTKIVPVGKDETAALLRSMANMQQRLSSLIAAQRELSSQQSQGNNSYRVDASAYPGAFGQLVRETNQLVENNGALIAQIVATTASYSIGDLSVRMPPLPGEQAVITDAMETTRSNLLAVSSDIQRLAAAAAQGDFSQRGDATRFQHAFRDIVLDLNRLFDVTDSSMAEISKLLVAIAACDLTQQAKGEFAGVFAGILASAGATADNLRGIIRGIQASTSVISTSASEIAMGNSDLSQRTEQQAANLEETAASMEELTSTVRQNADHARQAAQLAQVAEESASAGDQTVRDVIVTMEQIKASSARVADIISVIDGIAFQTNILALNAAVEAARAGEQGRGFAVVASEVRTLAQRSAGAAKDVKTLIEGSAEQVRQGVTLVEDAGAAMRGIAHSIQQVRHAVAEIAAASQEQSAGIEQVNQAVVHMDEVTQQNAALVEEASAASKSLEEQAAVLNNAVAVFKVS